MLQVRPIVSVRLTPNAVSCTVRSFTSRLVIQTVTIFCSVNNTVIFILSMSLVIIHCPTKRRRGKTQDSFKLLKTLKHMQLYEWLALES